MATTSGRLFQNQMAMARGKNDLEWALDERFGRSILQVLFVLGDIYDGGGEDSCVNWERGIILQSEPASEKALTGRFLGILGK